MGTVSSLGFSNIFPQGNDPRLQRLVPSSSDMPGQLISSPNANDLFSAMGVGEGDQLSMAMYHAQMQRVALQVGFQQTSTVAGAASGGDDSAEAASQHMQLSFSFDAESRTESLALFNERTAASASGMEGSQRETYIQASQRISVKFQMSATLSGQVLDAFSKGTDKLEGAESDLLDKWLGLTQDALDTDDIANQIFELLDGFFSGVGDGQDVGKALDKLIDQIYGAFWGNQGVVPSGGQSVKGAQSLNIQLEFQFEFSGKIQIAEAELQQSDPITFDLDGDGIELTSYKQGARFDITGTGRVVQTAFVTGGDAFLAIDRNGNGAIDDGTELFGDQNGAANGFEELKKYDSNGDGVINAKDKEFSKLLLFKDNGDGRTQAGELSSLSSAGITELSLNYTNVSMRASGGNSIGQIASYRKADGTSGQAVDSILNFKI